MAIYETFSKRMMRLTKQGQAEVYQYSDLPGPFRVQVSHIWDDAIGPYVSHQSRSTNEAWDFVHDTLAREMGVFSLANISGNAREKCHYFLLNGGTDGVLDVIELSFKYVDTAGRNMNVWERDALDLTQEPDEAISELNHRFREHGIGYHFESGRLVRVDSQYVHAEVIKPALSLLHDAGFEGASEEFLKAHEHYRHGRQKEAIAEALKAFESTMKAICDARKWSYSASATARPLIELLFEKGLIPEAMQSYFTALRSNLESGLPTLRNKTSGHGQGKTPITVPDYLAGYAIHLAASNILMLVEAHRNFDQKRP